MQLRDLLTGGDRRSIARAPEAFGIATQDSLAVAELAKLATDSDPLVASRACDVLEKLARANAEWVQPYKHAFLNGMDHPYWEARLQCVRAVSLFSWRGADRKRALTTLRMRIDDEQKFVRCWALDSFATLFGASHRAELSVRLDEFLGSGIPSMRARASTIAKRVS